MACVGVASSARCSLPVMSFASVLSPPVRTHTARGLFPRRLPHGSVGSASMLHHRGGSAHGVPPPFSGLRCCCASRHVSAWSRMRGSRRCRTSRAQPQPPEGDHAAGRAGRFSPCALALRNSSPSLAPRAAPFEDFPSSTAGATSRWPVPSCRYEPSNISVAPPHPHQLHHCSSRRCALGAAV